MSEYDVRRAENAINRLYEDASVSQETTLKNLKDLRIFLQELIDVLEEELS